jgi:hypothetical protein
LEASLRGRPLNGVHIKLNDKVRGLVVNEKRPKGDAKTRGLELQSTFDGIYSWRLDEPNTSEKTDPLARAITEWYSASEIVSAKLYLELN